MMNHSDRPKLTFLERMLVLFTFICLGFWINTFCMVTVLFGIVIPGPILCLFAVVCFSLRAVSYIRTGDVACVRGKSKKHFVLSLLAAVFWTVLAGMVWYVFYDTIFYAFAVKKCRELIDVIPYNAIFITPTITAIYFILMSVLRWKNRMKVSA